MLSFLGSPQQFSLLPLPLIPPASAIWYSIDGQKVDKDFVNEVLQVLGVDGKKDSLPATLSGGQQQRVAIARALVTKPAIIFADEPTGNLDSKTEAEVIKLLKLSAKKYDQTIVMITHDENIANMADRVITIEDGKVK